MRVAISFSASFEFAIRSSVATGLFEVLLEEFEDAAVFVGPACGFYEAVVFYGVAG